jgi:hypothetical protein
MDVRSIYWAELEEATGSTHYAALTYIVVGDNASYTTDESNNLKCEDDAGALVTPDKSGFYKCNRKGRYVTVVTGNNIIQFCDLKIFSDHTTIFYNFVETTTASTAVATFEASNA